MRSRRLARGLFAPLALLALVATLGTLQYRWLGQVSEAEREQLRESLDRHAREFVADFDREITRVYQALQPGASFDPAAPDQFLAHYDHWVTSAPAPALVKAVYFAKATSRDFALYRFDPGARAFTAIDWPSSLDVVRQRLGGAMEDVPATGAPATRVFTFTTMPIVAEVPAILIPLPLAPDGIMPRMGPNTPVDHDFLMAIRLAHSHVIVELDAAYLKDELVPSLITRHFSESGSVRYRVAVVDPASAPIASRNLESGERIDPERADLTAPFFTVRPETMRSATVTWSAPIGPAAGGGGMVMQPLASVTNQVAVTVAQPALRMTLPPGHWRLLVQHSAGSLDAAVGAARRRNLWLSFGILAVLAASAGLIVINARRSERLAGQQMDFVATVSHELRTPLAVIRSAAQNLSAGVVHEPGQARRYGDLIETEGRRLTEMVEQVLEYAGLEGDRRLITARPVDAGSLATEVVTSCSSLFEAEGVEVTTAVAADLPPVVADEGAMRRALHNLLTNALKYAAGGRAVRVEVQAASVRGQREVQIAVSDRGPGIAAEDLAHIFEPFYRGRNATEQQIHGNGLGLSLVKRIAQAHGGRVTVKSTSGGQASGATFTIHLPAATAG